MAKSRLKLNVKSKSLTSPAFQIQGLSPDSPLLSITERLLPHCHCRLSWRIAVSPDPVNRALSSPWSDAGPRERPSKFPVAIRMLEVFSNGILPLVLENW